MRPGRPLGGVTRGHPDRRPPTPRARSVGRQAALGARRLDNRTVLDDRFLMTTSRKRWLTTIIYDARSSDRAIRGRRLGRLASGSRSRRLASASTRRPLPQVEPTDVQIYSSHGPTLRRRRRLAGLPGLHEGGEGPRRHRRRRLGRYRMLLFPRRRRGRLRRPLRLRHPAFRLVDGPPGRRPLLGRRRSSRHHANPSASLSTTFFRIIVRCLTPHSSCRLAPLSNLIAVDCSKVCFSPSCSGIDCK